MIIISAVAAVALVCTMVYFLAFRTFTVLSDSAFSTVLPKAELRRLGLSLALKGIRLKVDALEDAAFLDEQTFLQRIGKEKGSWVLLSPACSAFCVSNGISAVTALPESVVIAMYANPDTELFDCTLVSSDLSGWIAACDAVSEEMQRTSSNCALIYELDGFRYAKELEQRFAAGRLSVFVDDGESRIFVSDTASELDRQNIVLALSPYEGRLHDFFSKPGTVRWVVDYRFAPAVPESQLYGVVTPDLESAIETALRCEKGSFSAIDLEYTYERI